MNRKIIIFDMDGVLFDSEAVAVQSLMYQYPGMTKEMQKEVLTGNFHEEIAKITILKIEETEEEKSDRQRKYAEDKAKSPMYDGIKELLTNLHKDGYTIAMNTSALDRNCIPLIEGAGITNFFDFIATAELSRSKVEKFKIIKNKYGVEESNMLFVTDTLGDIREADLAGVPTVAVTWGAHDRSYFSREPHDNLIGIVDTVSELEAFIKK